MTRRAMQHLYRNGLVALIACFLIWICPSASMAQVVTSKPLCSWKIAFVKGGNIWVANGDGSGQKRVITNGCAPSWSPDHKHIAFARRNNVWTASADGTSQKCLTHFKALSKKYASSDDIEISWRPGTGQITFSHPDEFTVKRTRDERFDPVPGERSIGGNSIFDVSSRGGTRNREKVRFDLYDYAGEIHFPYHTSPAWSSNGKRLLFVRSGDIWVATHTQYDPEDTRPGWDVERLASVAVYDEAAYRADTSNRVARHIAWSPDGKSVAYGFGRVGSNDSEVYLLSLQYSDHDFMIAGKSQLISEPFKPSSWPTFSPDSKFVAYESQGDIWVASLKNDQRKRLIRNGEQPAW